MKRTGSPAQPAGDGGAKPPTPAGFEWATYRAPDDPPDSPAEHLRKWRDEHKGAERVLLLLKGDYDVSRLEDEGIRGLLVSAAQEVHIRPRDEGDRVTLRLGYDASGGREFVALRIRSQKSTVRGVRFQIDAHAANLTMQALRLGEGGSHEVTGCEFIQADPQSLEGGRRVASLLIDPGAKQARVAVSDCVFIGLRKRPAGGSDSPRSLVLGGQDAIVRRGSAALTASNCLFGPHANAFRLEGGGEPTPLTVEHCSILLPARQSTVFELAGGSGPIEMAASLVSRLPDQDLRPRGEGADDAVLLRRPEGRRDWPIVFRGKENGYHALDGYWVVGQTWRKAGWTDFRDRLAKSPDSRDEHSRIIRSWPWDLTPAALVRELEQFGSEPGRLPASLNASFNLQLPALRLSSASGGVLGAGKILGKSWLPDPLPAVYTATDRGPSRTLLVEEAGDDTANGVYGDIEGAVNAARSGDTIQIRHDGEWRLKPVRIDNGDLTTLTVGPARNFRPVLVLEEGSVDAQPTMFHVPYCKVVLQGLEFLLRPGNAQLQSQAVVQLAGDGECLMRDCVATFQKAAAPAELALATLGSPGALMRPNKPAARSRDEGPRLALLNCYVRGDGDLVSTRFVRPFAVDLTDSLAALSGSLLRIDVPAEDRSPPASQKVVLTIQRSTTYLKSSLVRLKTGKEIAGLLPIECEAKNCLIVPASPRLALLHIEAPEGKEGALRDRFTWSGGENQYGDFAGKFNPDPTDTMPTGMEQWQMPDESSVFNVKPPKGWSAEGLAGSPALRFAWPDKTAKAGVDPATLPLPSSR